MDVIYFIFLLAFAKSYGERIEIPAYEYLKRFQQPLSLGQCPDRLITYSWGDVREQCTFPSRTGSANVRFKKVELSQNTVLHNVSELFNQFPLCDRNAANYLGILNRGDCVATEIASKLSFKSRTSTRMYLEHYRPIISILNPSTDLNIPSEFTLHFNNTFYTENIGIGTEEVIVLELSFGSLEEARKADKLWLASTKLLSVYLKYIGRHIGVPKKIKVIHLSTSEQSLQSRVFKGKTVVADAELWLLDCEKKIQRVKNEIRSGRRESHLKYGFKEYEIPKGPIALPLTTVTEEQKRRSWEEVTLLQVEAKRVYVTYKRYRKICRSSRKTYSACPVVKHSLREVKKAISRIRSERLNWLSKSYEDQQLFITRGKQLVKNLRVTLKVVVKSLKKKKSGRRNVK